MKVALCNGEICNYTQRDLLLRISILFVTTVCSSSKYNVRPRSVLKKCWSKSFHYTDLLEGDFF